MLYFYLFRKGQYHGKCPIKKFSSRKSVLLFYIPALALGVRYTLELLLVFIESSLSNPFFYGFLIDYLTQVRITTNKLQKRVSCAKHINSKTRRFL